MANKVEEKVLEQAAGGASNNETVSFSVRVSRGDEWINTFPYTMFLTSSIKSLKSSVANIFGADVNTVRLYRQDGTEMTGGWLDNYGVRNGDVLNAVI